jgi:molybdate transport system regulatory protein
MRTRRRLPAHPAHARILSIADKARCLDAGQLQKLEQSFREWADAPRNPGLGISRQRILLIYLLIRCTGARLNEVLKLDPHRDIDDKAHAVVFRKAEREGVSIGREVKISEMLSVEIRKILKIESARRTEKVFSVSIPGMCGASFTSGPRPAEYRRNWGRLKSFAGPGPSS